MDHIPFIDRLQLEQLLSYEQLISALKTGFCKDYKVPLRQHLDYKNPGEGVDSTLLLMPAWKSSEHLGVKIVTVSPNNGKHELPAVQGTYILFDATTGTPLAFMEAKTLTCRRTAAASALAASYLARPDSETLLMIGTGAMAPELIKAHATIRPIKKVYIWGRNFEKAKKIQTTLKGYALSCEAIVSLSEVIPKADIISCATLSNEPIIPGKLLVKGQHVDLVGSFKPDMREADDEVLKRASIFVDILEGATKESGDLVIPLREEIITMKDIKGDLFSLCRNKIQGRISPNEITCFKSVGYALEDLVAAQLVYKTLSSIKTN